jgi:hypothetical protein
MHTGKPFGMHVLNNFCFIDHSRPGLDAQDTVAIIQVEIDTIIREAFYQVSYHSACLLLFLDICPEYFYLYRHS